MGCSRTAVKGSTLWLLWLLFLAHGAVWRANSAPVCSSACSADVEAVCGKDGRTYANRCLASCAGVDVSKPGYCSGEKFRFIKAGASSSGTSQHPASNLRVPRDSAAIISHAVINRFHKEGTQQYG
ncbi:hypothetical protein OEZ85_013978 [Tetradesmus obliquus]|uniref:Kazal-like domain-containing protein n=1 Tax=Tetradesmus obliquus TaxID=3088 RepID=A0ABY8U8U3_TETOB|nr:hypothetical protein OEZ85_013978 [Tetradesmus obliquus]